MAAKKPLVMTAGHKELLQSGDTLDIGGYTIPGVGGSEGDILVMGAANAEWGTTTISTLTVGGISTSGSVNSATVIATGDIRIVSDSAQLELGDSVGGDYQVGWDGANAVHTISEGAFNYVGGPLGVPEINTSARDALTPANGMAIYNTTDEQFQDYEDGTWVHKVAAISTPTTFYVKTTGNDTTGDGTDGNPWATVDKALSHVGNFILLAATTIAVERGSYPATSYLVIKHTQGKFLTIEADYETDTTSLTVTSGSAGDWTFTLATANTSKYTVDDYILIYSVSGGTDPDAVYGPVQVKTINSGVNLTVHSTNSKATSSSGASTATVSIPQVKWVRAMLTQTALTVNGIQIQWDSVSATTPIINMQPATEKVFFNHTILVNTNASQHGCIRLYTPGYAEFLFCGGRNLLWGIYATAEINVQWCGFMSCTVGIYQISSPLTYSACNFVSNGTGIVITNMASAFVGYGGRVLSGNSTDASPALDSEGNYNSYMGP